MNTVRVQVGFNDVVTETSTYEKILVSSSYPIRDVLVERQVIVTDPAKAIYRTVIPNQVSCGGKTHCCAPIKANVDGSLPILPKIDQKLNEQAITVASAVDHADFVIEPGSTIEEIKIAQDKARRILSGEHHVDNFTKSGIAKNQTNVVTTQSTSQDSTVQVLPLVDIETKFRPDPTLGGKAGFFPIGGENGTDPSKLLPPTDKNRFGTAQDLVTRPTKPDGSPLDPKDDPLPPSAPNQINKFVSEDGTPDTAVVSNDMILKLDPKAPATTPSGVTEPRAP